MAHLIKEAVGLMVGFLIACGVSLLMIASSLAGRLV